MTNVKFQGLEEFLIGNDDDNDAGTDDGMSIGIDTDIRYCACGCGTVLPATGKHAYKRGHKLNAMSREVDPDPDRPDIQPGKSATYSGTRITKQMKADIEGQCGLLLMLISMGFATRDSICGAAWAENADKIAEKMVPVICKSPALVKWLTRGSNMQAYIELFLAFLPVGKTMLDHHILHTQVREDTDSTPVNLYPVS